MSTPPPAPLPYASDAYPSAAPAVAAGVVPWADLPYRSPVDPDPAAHPAGSAPWCTNRDLVLGKGGPGDGAGGALEFAWPLLARPGHRCSLQGYPTVRMRDARHTWSLTSDVPDRFGVPSGAVVDDKHPGRLAFRWGIDASGYSPDVGRTPRLLTFGLPHDGGALTTTDSTEAWNVPGRTPPATPRDVGRISVLALWSDGRPVYGGAYARGYPASILQRSVALTPGQPLSYDVWIGGPEGITRGGPSCFGYRERLRDDKTDRVVAEETHELDCRALVDLPRRGRVLAMRLRVPPTVTPGDPLELDWQADTDLSGGSSAEVTTAAATS